MKRLFFLSLLLSNIALFGMNQGPVATQEPTIETIEALLVQMCLVGEDNIGSALHTMLKRTAIRLLDQTKGNSRDPFVLALAALFTDNAENKFEYAQKVVALMKVAGENNQTNPRHRTNTATLHRRAQSEAALNKLKSWNLLRYKPLLTDREQKQQLLAQIRAEVIEEAIRIYKEHNEETH